MSNTRLMTIVLPVNRRVQQVDARRMMHGIRPPRLALTTNFGRSYAPLHTQFGRRGGPSAKDD